MAESSTDFPIVGVGASAGGLAAYKKLLRTLPTDTGAAFILIQHLDPNHESMMADLLGRATSMRVVQAEHKMALSPNTVYVIPPAKFLRLIDHGLFLDEPVQEKGIRLSVDYFFRSLAETRGEKSIGIVLSGTGSDGTLGIREIKAAGGMVMVQQPDDAEYDGMPRSAVATGAVDFVVPVTEMGERLQQFLRHPYLVKETPQTGLSDTAPDGFKEIIKLLKKQTDYDFRSYKKGTVERRIQRRMGLRQIKELDAYVELLRETPEEVNLLFRDLLIGVTRFFREPEAWEAFGRDVVDPLIARKPRGGTIRAWVPGCASGEEAYTLAMTLFDRIGRQNDRVSVQIFATDLNDRAIETARAGRYSAAIATDIPERMRQRFFTDEDDTLRVAKRLRETVVFATQNVISDPPFSKLDLITCRNLMIYLESEVQQRMIEMFHFALADDGHLFLGSSENAERPGRLFTPVDKANRIYRRSDVARVRTGSFPIVPGNATRRPGGGTPPAYSSSMDQARRQLLERFVPASVLVDRALEVQYFHGPVRNYLDFPTGEPTSLLPEMALPALRTKLRGALNSILNGKSHSDAVAKRVPRNGHEIEVRITAESLGGPDDDGNILVYFEDRSEPRDAAEGRAEEAGGQEASPEARDQVTALEYELQSTREDLQSTIEEMETANEELKASNEEVMSMNEELQSTNEELETSREELQSLNEEHSTVNGQLEDKIDELEQTNNDLKNLLVSTDIGVIFLDTDLAIRRFTPAMKDIMRIIDTDVGRPVEDIAMRVQDRALIADARRSPDKLQEIEAEVTTDDGRHLIRRLRPYRTSENRIEGVVVTYTDVSKLQDAREGARQREEQQAAVSELGREALSGGDPQDVLRLATESVAQQLDVRFAKVLELDPDGRHLTLRAGVGWKDGLIGQAKVHTGARSQAGYTLVRSSPVVVRDFATERRFTAPSLLTDHDIQCGASIVIGPSAAPWGILAAHEIDVDRCAFSDEDVNFMQSVAHVLWLHVSRNRAMAEIERERSLLRDLADSLPALFAVVDADGRYEFANSAHAELGGQPGRMIGRSIAEGMGGAVAARLTSHVDGALAGETQHFEIDLPRSAGEMRSYMATYVPRWNDVGAVNGFFAFAMDITEQKRLERDAAERFEQYRVLGESIPFGVWITDAEGRLTYVSQSLLDVVGMTLREARTEGWIDRLPADEREPVVETWRKAREAGEDWQAEYRLAGEGGETFHVLAIGRPVRDRRGAITSWVGLNLDITARKDEEERLEVVSAELDHRVKNLLATVSTIARLTGQTAGTVADYQRALNRRIQAMAASHKLLAEGNWSGMDLHTLLRTELRPYMVPGADRIVLDGPPLRLVPRSVQLFSLAFHELTTNAAKYGALSKEEGRLEVRWTLDGAFRLTWAERGLSGVTAPDRDGFGTLLLTRILAAQGVEARLDFRDGGLEARLVADEPGAILSGAPG